MLSVFRLTIKDIMNPFENVRASHVQITGATVAISINLIAYPQVSTKEAIDAGMAYYVQKHHPRIRSWEARANGSTLNIFVTGDIDASAVLRMM